MRAGVLLCDCQGAVARKLDLDKLAEALTSGGKAAFAVKHSDICHADGAARLKELIGKEKPERLVVAACGPGVHESYVRPVARDCGLSDENCVSVDLLAYASTGDQQTAQAVIEAALGTAGEKGGTVKRALVIGGGIAGIQAALDIANAGYPVTLVEREGPPQFELFENGSAVEAQRDRVVSRVMDDLRERFGDESILPGRMFESRGKDPPSASRCREDSNSGRGRTGGSDGGA